MGSWFLSFLVVSAVLIGYMAFFDFLIAEIPIRKLAEAIRQGTFGDSFGTLNALFSGLAFSGVLITVLLQRKELSEARKQTVNQQIESQFYNMLSLQQNVVQGFDIKRGVDIVMVGRDCFKSYVNRLNERYNSYAIKLSPNRVLETYDAMWQHFRGDLSIYYRSLYSVFRFVSACDHPKKRDFAVVARSFLSDYELVVLFYNCLSPRGENFKVFAYEFQLFNNLDPKLLLEPKHIKLLDKRAYGENAEIQTLYDS
ncbi:putative phage abortive infection protein [Pseudomonas monteilii]|uniref:putative phage abortive infection protein n=1 Tax=Pseudomonas monteilii TaxID=76759 RepID=UPI0036E4FDC2